MAGVEVDRLRSFTMPADRSYGGLRGFLKMRRALAQVADRHAHPIERTFDIVFGPSCLFFVAKEPTELIHGASRRLRLREHIGKRSTHNAEVLAQFPDFHNYCCPQVPRQSALRENSHAARGAGRQNPPMASVTDEAELMRADEANANARYRL